jgi:hypothetical protein
LVSGAKLVSVSMTRGVIRGDENGTASVVCNHAMVAIFRVGGVAIVCMHTILQLPLIS